MRRARTVALAALLAVAAPVAAHAEPAPRDPLDIFGRTDSGEVGGSFVPASADGASRVTVMVEMAQDPVAVVEADGGPLTGAERKALKADRSAAQDRIAPAIAKLGGEVLSTVQTAYNGVKVSIAPDGVAALADLPGVKAVHAVAAFEPDDTAADPYLGVDRVWEDTGFTGEGVKVAVIDSGIDYTHATFGGPGTQKAFYAAWLTSAGEADPALFGADAPRVKGGWDFVGDAYTGAGDTPQPDPNPLDCAGHGTHIAGVAGGGGVAADGTPYTGPYDDTTASRGLLVDPGVAPEVDLYALRVLGCTGSTDMTVEAIDWAVEHDMDVINLSLGFAYGTNDDPASVAATNAAAAGIVVVASAGNAGPNAYVTSAPGAADGVVSVAALDTTGTGLPGYAVFSSGGPRSGDSALKPTVSAPGVSVQSAAVGTGTGSFTASGTSVAVPFVAGAAALGVQAHPGWSGQEVSAALASTADPTGLADYRLTVGGGPVDAGALVGTDTFAYGDETQGSAAFREPALSFGFAELAGDFAATRTVTVVNRGSTSQTFALSYEPTDESLPAAVSFGRDRVTVPAGGTATVKVTLRVAPRDVPATAAGTGQQAFQEVSGSIVLTGADRTHRIGYLLVPRPSTKVSASIRGSLNGTKTSATLVASNMGAVTDGDVNLFTWGLKDGQDQHVDGGFDLRAAGVQSFTYGGATYLVFAVSTHDRFSNAAGTEFDVRLDVDRDGTYDWALVGYDHGTVTTGDPDGDAGVFLYNYDAEVIVSTGYLASAPTDSSTVLMPLPASWVGIDGAFDYSVVSYNRDLVADQFAGRATYDPTGKALSDGQYATVAAGAKASIPVTKDPEAFTATDPLGFMAVAYDNPAGAEALLVPVN